MMISLYFEEKRMMPKKINHKKNITTKITTKREKENKGEKTLLYMSREGKKYDAIMKESCNNKRRSSCPQTIS